MMSLCLSDVTSSCSNIIVCLEETCFSIVLLMWAEIHLPWLITLKPCNITWSVLRNSPKHQMLQWLVIATADCIVAACNFWSNRNGKIANLTTKTRVIYNTHSSRNVETTKQGSNKKKQQVIKIPDQLLYKITQDSEGTAPMGVPEAHYKQDNWTYGSTHGIKQVTSMIHVTLALHGK